MLSNYLTRLNIKRLAKLADKSQALSAHQVKKAAELSLSATMLAEAALIHSNHAISESKFLESMNELSERFNLSIDALNRASNV